MYKNDGALKGDPKWAEGVFNSALELDGVGDYVEVENSESLQIKEALTISCWVKLGLGGDVLQTALEKGGWEPGLYSLMAVYDNDSTLLQFFDLPDGMFQKIVPSLEGQGWVHFDTCYVFRVSLRGTKQSVIFSHHAIRNTQHATRFTPACANGRQVQSTNF